MKLPEINPIFWIYFVSQLVKFYLSYFSESVMPNVEYFLTLTDDSLDTVVVEKQLNMINN